MLPLKEGTFYSQRMLKNSKEPLRTQRSPREIIKEPLTPHYNQTADPHAVSLWSF